MDSFRSLMKSMFEEYDTKLQKLGSVAKIFSLFNDFCKLHIHFHWLCKYALLNSDTIYWIQLHVLLAKIKSEMTIFNFF